LIPDDDDTDGAGRRVLRAADAPNAVDAAKPKRKRSATPEVGHALRAAYQRTIDENIPPEMLDLLGKLG
jgi:hypothetical protein